MSDFRRARIKELLGCSQVREVGYVTQVVNVVIEAAPKKNP